MSTRHDKLIRWTAAAVCTFCWAYAFVARFTNFFMAPRSNKFMLMLSAMAAFGILSAFIFHRLLPKVIREIHVKSFLKNMGLSALAAAALMVFIIPPLYFPEHHVLEITPKNGSLTIMSIQRIELPGGQKLDVPPSLLDLQSGWQTDLNNGSISWSGEPEAKITFGRLMQAGIEIILQAGPQQGSVQIVWDGQEYNLDLYAPTDSTNSIVLMPALDWSRADLTRKMLVGFAIASELLGLSAFFTIISFLPKVISIRNSKTLIICAAALLLLMPLVNAADPPVQFQDAHLETAIREILDQPAGIIRLHKLLTIARLDLSAREIAALEGIQYLRNLTSLNLRDNRITDIDQLSQLKRLSSLNLRGNMINDIAPLSGLTKLESLNLRGNPIVDLSPLGNLTGLQDLNLNGISLGNELGFLRNFPDLSRLNIRNCSITDITLLAELMARGILQDDPSSGILAHVDLRDNPIPHDGSDGFASVRPYWDNITERVPFVLPAFNTLDEPTFSHLSGFYEDEFQLLLTTQDPLAVIHYTLDGSEPTRDSLVYNQPIQIRSRVGEPDQLSVISDASPQWKVPIGEVFKAAVVRAKIFRSDGTHSASAAHTYFVDQGIFDRYHLPIVSISTDPDNFFGYDQGIYVMGRIHDEQYGQPENVAANYHQRGGQSERPVHIEFFDTNGLSFLSQDGGVRIHGATTRLYPQKSLLLYASNWYTRSDYFDYEFFADSLDAVENDPIPQYKTLLLRNSGNNWNYPMFRDAILETLVNHTSLDTRAYQPIIVFLDGEYWGIYSLRENFDAYYLAAHYQIDASQIVVLERDNQINTGAPGDEVHYQNMLDFISNNDIKLPENYNYVSTQMDIDNFIDYEISEIYSGNKNWPHDNIKFWRYKSDAYQPAAPSGQDGRWRWLLFDLDSAFGYGNQPVSFQDNTLLKAEETFLFRSLIGNAEFSNQFINRFADHLNSSFQADRVISVIDEMQSALKPDMPEHIRRWNILENSVEEWDKNVDVMRAFARQRPDHVRQFILDYFKLPGTARIILRTDSAKGSIRINSIEITPDTPGVLAADEWSGIYFQGVPVTVTAIPNPGYEFAGWDGIDQSEPVVTLNLQGDLELTALFIQE